MPTDPPHIFADAAPALRRAGFAVLPARGKEPIRTGYTKWKYAPSPNTVATWAQKNPTANVVYIPGLCRNECDDRRPLVVVDSEDEETAHDAERRWGRTPGMVKTRRGHHALYRDGGAALGKISSLKRYGFNGDLKHGHSIVMAPPSIHPDDGSIYSWEGCDPTVMRDLPEFNARALQDLIDRGGSQGPLFHPSENGQKSQCGESPHNATVETDCPPPLRVGRVVRLVGSTTQAGTTQAVTFVMAPGS